MKVKLNSLLDDASGRFGDTVFARNPSGLYLRKHVDPNQPDSERQITIRERFTLMSARWKTLTDAQRTGWIALAGQVTKTGRYGDTYTPSGHRLYLAVNTTRAELGDAPLDTPPAMLPSVAPVAGFAPSLAIAAGSLAFRLGAAATPLATRVLILASEPHSAGRSGIADGAYRLIGTGAVGDAMNADIASLYTDKFGTPPSGSKVGVQIVAVDSDGFQGSDQRAMVEVS